MLKKVICLVVSIGVVCGIPDARLRGGERPATGMQHTFIFPVEALSLQNLTTSRTLLDEAPRIDYLRTISGASGTEMEKAAYSSIQNLLRPFISDEEKRRELSIRVFSAHAAAEKELQEIEIPEHIRNEIRTILAPFSLSSDTNLSAEAELERTMESCVPGSPYSPRGDWTSLATIESLFRETNTDNRRRIEFYERALILRKPLWGRDHSVDFALALIEICVASVYKNMGKYESAFEHIQRGLKFMERQGPFVNSTTEPLRIWQMSQLHAEMGEIFHARWAERSEKSDLEAAIVEMREAFKDLNRTKIIDSLSERASIMAELSVYLAESCVYERSSERIDEVIGEAEQLMTAAEKDTPLDEADYQEAQRYIEFARGLIEMTRGRSKDAQKALRASWKRQHDDSIAIYLMAVALELGELDEARQWADHVGNKDTRNFQYSRLLGDLESALAEESEGQARQEHFKKALEHWEKIPPSHLDALAFDSRFYWSLVDAAVQAGDIFKAIKRAGAMLMHYPAGSALMARTFAKVFTERDQYIQLVDEMAALPPDAQPALFVSEMGRLLRNNSPQTGTLEFDALQLLKAFPARAKRYPFIAEWNARLKSKNFDAKALNDFFISLRKRVPHDLYSELLLDLAGDVVNDNPIENRARISRSYALVSRYVGELKWIIFEATSSAAGLAAIVELAREWLEQRRPWLTDLASKGKKVGLIDDLIAIRGAA
jgi:hypothetical protein